MSAEEYPELPNVQQQSDLVLKQGVLKSMIDQTLFAIATTDSKPVHTGSLFDIKDSCVTLVSVDGYRLALRREPIVSDLTTQFTSKPGKTLSEISSCSRKRREEVYLVVSSKHIVFPHWSDIMWYPVCWRGFPRLQRCHPKIEQDNRQGQHTQLDRCSRKNLSSSPTACAAQSAWQLPNRPFSLTARPPWGKAHDEVECEMTGEPVSMGFNNKYLLDALKASDCDMIKMEINGALSPMRVMPLEGGKLPLPRTASEGEE